jgi:hypothetical protein
LLEASGWAVNGQLPVSLLLGCALTSEASIPDNSSRTRNDPLMQTSRTGKFLIAVIIVLLMGLGYLGWTGDLARVAKMAVSVEQPDTSSSASTPPVPSESATAPAPAEK